MSRLLYVGASLAFVLVVIGSPLTALAFMGALALLDRAARRRR